MYHSVFKSTIYIVTHLACNARARIPDARGAAAEVSVNWVVHVPFKSVLVICRVIFIKVKYIYYNFEIGN